MAGNPRLDKVVISIVVVSVLPAIIAVSIALALEMNWASTSEGLSAVRRNYALIIAGVLGLGIAIWRGVSADKQVRVMVKQLNLAERGHMTDRFSKAVDQLGNENSLSVRVGGIYALQHIGQDATDTLLYTVHDVLTNFIRQPPYPSLSKEEKEHAKKFPIRSHDVTAALEVLQLIKEKHPLIIKRAVLSYMYLEYAQLNHFDFEGSDFSYSNLINAHLSGGNFSGCNFTGTHFEAANFTNSIIFLSNFLEQTLKVFLV